MRSLLGAYHVWGPFYQSRAWLAWLQLRMGMSATTIAGRVYLADQNDFADLALRMHEEIHIEQQTRMGWWTFLWGYLREFWRGFSFHTAWKDGIRAAVQDSWWQNRYEVEAREKTRRRLDSARRTSTVEP